MSSRSCNEAISRLRINGYFWSNNSRDELELELRLATVSTSISKELNFLDALITQIVMVVAEPEES